MKRYLGLVLILINGILSAQDTSKFDWYKVDEMRLSGKIDAHTSNPFQRFPDSMKDLVRKRVWDLSENPAGVYVDFETNSDEVIVKYEVNGPIEFPHMPATGVSGIDLYAMDGGSWKWVKGNYNFSDTISYKFRLNGKSTKTQNKLRLYLPLYNTVTYMEVGVKGNSNFKNLPKVNKKPIVVYGTSITQGACAGRPGTAWTSILSREIGIPLLNYGFSGNGRLEEEIINYLAQIEAEVFVFDCLANFTSGQGLGAQQAKVRLIEGVKTIRKSHPATPIIFTDHAGYPHGEVYYPEKEKYLELNLSNREAFEKLKGEGFDNIYLLGFKELGLDQDNFIDGVHPNDAGMMKYADAYTRLLRKLVK